MYNRTDHLIKDATIRKMENNNIFNALRKKQFPVRHAKKVTNSNLSLKKIKDDKITEYKTVRKLPYIRGISERIKRILNEVGVVVIFYPHKTFCNILPARKMLYTEN